MQRKDEEAIAKLKEVNRLLTRALEQCKGALREVEGRLDTGQDNEPRNFKREN